MQSEGWPKPRVCWWGRIAAARRAGTPLSGTACLVHDWMHYDAAFIHIRPLEICNPASLPAAPPVRRSGPGQPASRRSTCRCLRERKGAITKDGIGALWCEVAPRARHQLGEPWVHRQSCCRGARGPQCGAQRNLEGYILCVHICGEATGPHARLRLVKRPKRETRFPWHAPVLEPVTSAHCAL